MSTERVAQIQVHDKDNIKGFFGPYRWLSNFHLCIVEYMGLGFPSSENAYQAAKTLDYNLRKSFVGVTPSESKKMGTSHGLMLREDWEDVKVGIMREILYNKFLQNDDLREKLLLTGDKYLEETNWWGDRFWGVCNGKGENMLGKLLMEVREELRKNVQYGKV